MTKDKQPGTEIPRGPEDVLTDSISIMDGKNLTLNVGDKKILSLDCDPGNATEPVNWSSSNESAATVDGTGTVTAVNEGTATITATTAVKKNTTSIEVTVKGKPTGVDLPYGTYTGPSKNGKPHGVGRLVYSKAMVINSHDPKKRMAQPGESVQGQFVNGEITIGKHFDESGNLIQSLNFGVAP
ncbi:MAG: Ig-like domain-containing protein [Bacteroides sp.]